jgi:hypothetical protein
MPGDSEKSLAVSGCYMNIQEWISTLNSEKIQGQYMECHPAQTIHCTKPKSPEKKIHWKFNKANQHVSPATFMVVLPHGRVWGDNGVVITPDNKLLGCFHRIS